MELTFNKLERAIWQAIEDYTDDEIERQRVSAEPIIQSRTNIKGKAITKALQFISTYSEINWFEMTKPSPQDGLPEGLRTTKKQGGK